MTLTATRNYGCATPVLTELAVAASTFPTRPGLQALLTDLCQREYDVMLGKHRVTIRLTGDAPAWLDPTIRTMQQLAALPANWSSYGSRPIEFVAMIRAANVLAEVLEPDGLAPTMVPTLQGGVQLEWHRNGDDVEVEFSPDGAVSDVYVYDRRTDRTWEPDQFTPEALQRLKTTINGLAQP
jgi:hypothetical protein